MLAVKRCVCIICAVTLLFCAYLCALAEDAPSAQALIERTVISYALYGERDEQALTELAALDAALAEKWALIMDVWEAPASAQEELPDGLPEDDTLCLVALGFQLNPDGTMRDELIRRLEVLLAAAKKYPQALIVCTGGGTAAYEPAATEAGRMAEWLMQNGIGASRIMVEDKSVTTAQNAIYTFDILEERQPQVTRIAVVSSDYHIETGVLLFSAEGILRGSNVTVAGNAAWRAPGGSLSVMFLARPPQDTGDRWRFDSSRNRQNDDR